MANLLPRELLLLSAASATGSGMAWRGGRGVCFVYGTFGGATATLQASPDGGTTWCSLGTAAAVTDANSPIGFEMPEGILLRVLIAGGAGITLTAKAIWAGLGGL